MLNFATSNFPLKRACLQSNQNRQRFAMVRIAFVGPLHSNDVVVVVVVVVVAMVLSKDSICWSST